MASRRGSSGNIYKVWSVLSTGSFLTRAQFISNQPFTETEFQKWRQTCEVEHVEMPSNQVN